MCIRDRLRSSDISNPNNHVSTWITLMYFIQSLTLRFIVYIYRRTFFISLYTFQCYKARSEKHEFRYPFPKYKKKTSIQIDDILKHYVSALMLILINGLQMQLLNNILLSLCKNDLKSPRTLPLCAPLVFPINLQKSSFRVTTSFILSLIHI